MPDWKSLIRSRIASLRLTPEGEADLTEELGQHLEDRYRELLQGGIEEADAYLQAAVELDDQDAICGLIRRGHQMSRSETVQVGSERSGNWLIDLWKDLRFAGRSLAMGAGPRTASNDLHHRIMLALAGAALLILLIPPGRVALRR